MQCQCTETCAWIQKRILWYFFLSFSFILSKSAQVQNIRNTWPKQMEMRFSSLFFHLFTRKSWSLVLLLPKIAILTSIEHNTWCYSRVERNEKARQIMNTMSTHDKMWIRKCKKNTTQSENVFNIFPYRIVFWEFRLEYTFITSTNLVPSTVTTPKAVNIDSFILFFTSFFF